MCIGGICGTLSTTKYMPVAPTLEGSATVTAVAEPLNWTLGDRLAKSRRKAGMEQADIAPLVGVSRALISKWERDLSEPTVTQAQRWADVTDAPIEWLLGLSASGYMLTSLPLDAGQLALPNMDNAGRPLPDPELAVA